MPRAYNLRIRGKQEKIAEEKAVEVDETDSDDSDYESPDTSISDSTSQGEQQIDTAEQQHITIPIPKTGRIKIEIDNRPRSNSMYSEEDDDQTEEGDDGFIGYLMNKYATGSNKKDKKASSLKLNDEEQEYYDNAPKKKRTVLDGQMKQIEALVAEGDVPRKFRVLDMPIPDSAKASVIKRIDTLDRMDDDSGDTHKLRSWIDGFMQIPFGKKIPLPVKMDDGAVPCAKFLSESRASLDKAVYGMQPAKTQIMQVLAQWIANPSSVGNVIALKGPMGVGKTSFAKNGIAPVLHRPFEFFSLGGATDSANFVGHGYTYEGSTWGRIVDSLINSRCMNPVMYFDELDKISDTAQGQEVVSMLIHLTDRSQNSQFHDRYFAGIDIDLSKCLFVFSFNDESKIHPILKDRIQVITCTGYNADDKFQIIDKYIWPQMLERTNFNEMSIKPEAIKFLIKEYSSEEEGVRTLIRALETLTSRINLLRIADEETAKSYSFYIKINLPCCIDTEMARHILQDLNVPTNDSWKRLYT